MNKEFIARHWYAGVYEQFENQTDDVAFFLAILQKMTGGMPQNILEVACGGGRISIPLAQAGHCVTGFDADEHMLLRCYTRMNGIPNVTCYQADAIASDWGKDFDIVLMAGNILLNIESDMEYALAQETFIRKAASALRRGGHLLMDYDQHTDESAVTVFNGTGEFSYFNGTDDLGTYGRTISYGGVYDPVTRIWTGVGHWELTMNNGEKLVFADEPRRKYIPTWARVCAWLADAGFVIDRTFKNYSDEPVCEHETDAIKATIWARKM